MNTPNLRQCQLVPIKNRYLPVLASPFLGTTRGGGIFPLPAFSLRKVESGSIIRPSFHARFTPMATFRKRGDSWRAEVYRKGIRQSGTFDSKAAAVAWAGRAEAEIMAGSRGEVPNLTFSDLLDRYLRDVSRTKKGHRWESIRIGLIKRDPIAQERLRGLGAPQVAAWRDRRLQAVSAPSVRREWNLLSHACNIAVKEWKWLTHNPFHDVRRPKSARPRFRVASDAEIAALAKQAITPSRQEVYRAFLVGIETGMRASEIISNPPITGRVAYLHDTKNNTSREVPLSERAAELLAEPFTIKAATLDALFRDMRDCAARELPGIATLHFHDSRHTACTRLSKRLNVLQLAAMLGIKDPRILMVYFNETAEEIAHAL